MTIRNFITRRLVLPILVIALGTSITASNQGWINNSLTLKIDSNVSIKFTNETRYDTLTYSGPFLKNWQGGFTYKLPRDFYVAALYKRETTDKSTFILSENRFTLEAGWKKSIGRKTAFDIRFRTEIRNYDKKRADNHLRFRLRLRLKTNLSIGNIKLKPFIAIEPFGDTQKNNINRYRFYIGTAFSLAKQVDWVLNYIRQGTKDKETIHILNTGVELKF